MLKKIESIRRKPREVRNRYAFGIAFAFTFVIAGFWMASMPARLNSLTIVLNQEQQATVTRDTSGSFSSLRAAVGSAWSELTNRSDNSSTRDTTDQSTEVPNQANTPEVTTPSKEDTFPVTFTQMVASSSKKRPKTDFGTPILIATSSTEVGVDPDTVDY